MFGPKSAVDHKFKYFLHLPAEIRIKIYDLVLRHTSVVYPEDIKYRLV